MPAGNFLEPKTRTLSIMSRSKQSDVFYLLVNSNSLIASTVILLQPCSNGSKHTLQSQVVMLLVIYILFQQYRMPCIKCIDHQCCFKSIYRLLEELVGQFNNNISILNNVNLLDICNQRSIHLFTQQCSSWYILLAIKGNVFKINVKQSMGFMLVGVVVLITVLQLPQTQSAFCMLRYQAGPKCIIWS